ELWKMWHKDRRLLCCNKIESNTRLFVCAPLSELKVFAAYGTPLESDHLCDPQTNPNLKSKILDDSLLTRHFAYIFKDGDTCYVSNDEDNYMGIPLASLASTKGFDFKIETILTSRVKYYGYDEKEEKSKDERKAERAANKEKSKEQRKDERDLKKEEKKQKNDFKTLSDEEFKKEIEGPMMAVYSALLEERGYLNELSHKGKNSFSSNYIKAIADLKNKIESKSSGKKVFFLLENDSYQYIADPEKVKDLPLAKVPPKNFEGKYISASLSAGSFYVAYGEKNGELAKIPVFQTALDLKKMNKKGEISNIGDSHINKDTRANLNIGTPFDIHMESILQDISEVPAGDNLQYEVNFPYLTYSSTITSPFKNYSRVSLFDEKNIQKVTINRKTSVIETSDYVLKKILEALQELDKKTAK
nr:hypothetical protein [Bacteriovoracaceae bacterium]